MDEQELRQLLQRLEIWPAKRGWRCPDDNRLVAYVTGQLEESKRRAFESHAAGCGFCTGAVAFLSQSAEWPDGIEVPAPLLTRTRSMVSERRPAVWRWRWALASAAAACIVLFVTLVALRFRAETPLPPSGPLVAQQHQPDFPVAQTTPAIQVPGPAPARSIEKPKSSSAQAPTTRSGAEELKPTLVLPRDGALLKPDQVRVRWKPLPGAVFYELKVVTEDGGLAIEKQATEAQLQLDHGVLQPGAKYFITIVAHLRDGRTSRSDVVSFRVAGQ